MIASNGIVIRIFGDTISEFARPAKGVRVMRVSEGEKLVSATAVSSSDEEETTDISEQDDAGNENTEE